MEDFEHKGGEAQGSALRHMLSIKRPAIRTRYTAPEPNDRSPGRGGGGGRPEEDIKKGGIGKEWKKGGSSKGEKERRRVEGGKKRQRRDGKRRE